MLCVGNSHGRMAYGLLKTVRQCPEARDSWRHQFEQMHQPGTAFACLQPYCAK